jgi:alpha-1,3-rhamnosyl/mannosyltransferase
MAHGTPSVVADNTAIPEVCGAAAVRCDPFDGEAIAAAIRTVLATPPSPAALAAQLEAVTRRQEADAARLVSLLFRPAAAARPASGRARAA